MDKKEVGRLKRRGRIRKKLVGTSERPRVSVHRSSSHLYVQVIDDIDSKTLAACSTKDKAFIKKIGKQNKVNKSKELGKLFGAELKNKSILKVAFDRGGYLYHGRIKALADALREQGIQF